MLGRIIIKIDKARQRAACFCHRLIVGEVDEFGIALGWPWEAVNTEKTEGMIDPQHVKD